MRYALVIMATIFGFTASFASYGGDDGGTLNSSILGEYYQGRAEGETMADYPTATPWSTPPTAIVVRTAEPTVEPTMEPQPTSTPITDMGVLDTLRAGGWPEHLLDEAASVVSCETGNTFDPAAYNAATVKYGWFQLDALWFSYAGIPLDGWADPVVNSRVAWATYQYDIERGQAPWTQWSCKPRTVQAAYSYLGGYRTTSLVMYYNPAGAPEGITIEQVKMALAVWNMPESGIRAVFGGVTDLPTSKWLEYDDGYSVIGWGNTAIGSANYAPDECDIRLGEGYDWSYYHVERVLAHEVGHCLGLGHSDVPGSLMWKAVGGQTLEGLGPDDIAALIAAYPAKEYKAIVGVS